MKILFVKTKGDICRHEYVQTGNTCEPEGKPYLTADFECRKCRRRRVFSIGMKGFWLIKPRREENAHV